MNKILLFILLINSCISDWNPDKGTYNIDEIGYFYE